MRPSDNLDNKTLSHILNSLTSMYEISGSQFFRTTTGIQSGPGCSRWIKVRYDLFNHLGSYKISCSFRLVLEGKTGKETSKSSRLEFLEKFLANNLALSDAKYNTSESLNRESMADLQLLRILLAICQKYQEPSF